MVIWHVPLGYPSFNTHKESAFAVLLLYLPIVLGPPEDGLIVEHDEDNNTVICYSSGLFPAPELSICVLDV